MEEAQRKYRLNIMVQFCRKWNREHKDLQEGNLLDIVQAANNNQITLSATRCTGAVNCAVHEDLIDYLHDRPEEVIKSVLERT